jgi:hypothetical protein
MKRLPIAALLLLLPLLPLHAVAQQQVKPPDGDPVAEELSHSLRRIASALERVLDAQRVDVELKQIEVASRVLQLHWDRIALLRSAAEKAEEAALKSEEEEQLMLAELDMIEDRERALRDAPAGENADEQRDRIRQVREEHKKVEAYMEQSKDRAWRLRDQAHSYRSELAEIRGRVTHLEAVIGRWLDDLE